MAALHCASLAAAAHSASAQGGGGERATALLRALPACAQHAHAAALSRLVRRGCSDDAELAAALAARAAKAAAGLPRSLTPAARLALLRWTLMAAEASTDDKVWGDVLTAHMALLSQLHGDGAGAAARGNTTRGAGLHPKGVQRTWRAAVACISRWLRQRPERAQQYANAAAAAAAAGNAAPAAALLRGCTAGSSALPAEVRTVLMACWTKSVAGAAAPPQALIDALAPLLATADDGEWSAEVTPALGKLLRKSPLQGARVARGALRDKRGLAEDSAVAIVQALVPACRHATPEAREEAAAAMRALAAAAAPGEAAVAVATAAVKALEVKPRPGDAKQRVGMYACAAAAAAAYGSAGRGARPPAAILESALVALAAQCKAEMNEPARIAAVEALGDWLAIGPAAEDGSPTPTAVVDVLAAGAADKGDAARLAYLRCLHRATASAAHTNGAPAGGLLPLVAPLAKAAQAAAAKAAFRGEGTFAVAALARIALLSPEGAAALAECKAWVDAVMAKEGVLLAPASAAKMGDRECEALADAARSVLLAEDAVPTAAREAAARLLAFLALHPRAVPRRAALDAVAAATAGRAGTTEAVLRALSAWMDAYTAQGADALAVEDADGAESMPGPVTFTTALFAATVPRKGAIAPARPVVSENAGVLVAYLLAASHPCVSAGKACKRIWKEVRKLRPEAVGETRACADAVLAALASEGGPLFSRVPRVREAACGALGGLAAVAGDEGGAAVAQRLAEVAARGCDAHGALSEEEIRAFNSPPTALPEEMGGSMAAAAEAAAEASLVMMRKGDDSSGSGTAAAAPKKKPSLLAAMDKAKAKKDKSKAAKTSGRLSDDRKVASKAAAAPKKTDKELYREERLRTQAETTARVEAATFEVRCALEGVGAVCCLAPSVARRGALVDLAEAVAPYVGSRVVGAEAFRAAWALLAALPGMREAAHGLAAALRLAASATPDEVTQQSCATEGVGALAASCGLAEEPVAFYPPPPEAQPLPPAAFSFAFPVLDAALRASLANALTRPALALCGLHSAPGAPMPRPAMLAACTRALSVSPGLAAATQPVLCRLCEGLDEVDLLAALEGALDTEPVVRLATLRAVVRVPALEAGTAASDPRVGARLFLACHDAQDENVAAAEAAWKTYGHAMDADAARELLVLLRHASHAARAGAAEALATALEGAAVGLPLKEALSTIFADYSAHAAEIPARLGVAAAMAALAPVMTQAELPVLAEFLLSKGLGDAEEEVRARMVGAGTNVIDAAGAEGAGALLPIFDRFTQSGQMDGDAERYDIVREGVVVLLGALAKHLPKGDPRVVEIAHLLLEVLTTPSESVQRAVAGCLPPLMPALTDKAPEITADLLKMLLKSPKFADRKGAAFGLAGAVKGLGMSALKAHGIIEAIKQAAADGEKGAANGREGAMFAVAALSETLGRLFEPYVMQVMPLILACLGDGMKAVRAAAKEAAQAIMAKLSGQGVKLVLPSLLKGLSDDAVWRTKQGSCQLLGSMAHMAPKQLSAALPKIVPMLAEALQDTHEKVAKAAKVALKEIGAVIKNPEVAALVPTLISAISNPAEKTAKCLDALLRTVFVNSVDPPSLALIIPVLARGMRERRPDDKRKACRVVGNITALVTDSKDITPYLDTLGPELRKAVLDPIPDVRATAAKALGSLLAGVGEGAFADLVQWLLDALGSEESAVERTGAAQALAEVCCALGLDTLDTLLPDIEARCRDKSADVREGGMGMWVYLPRALGDLFEPYVEGCLPFLLDGLADEAEQVREMALRAGRNIVDQYARSSMGILLPTMTDGLFNDSWRIRGASVELLGFLLFRVSGMSGKIQTSADSDDEGVGGAAQAAAITQALGAEARDRVLAAVYIARSDVAITVRQQSLHVWKTIVSNTPRTLKEILPVMMRTLIASLASDSAERQRIAGRALGDLVKKLGDRVLSQILPILQRDLESAADGDVATKQGVCFGLAEVMQAASREQLEEHLPSLLPAVQAALCDGAAPVRAAAADALSALVAMFGPRVVAATIEPMLQAAELGNDEAERALGGLREVTEVRSAAVVEFALPLLLPPPALTAGKCRVLEVIAEVAGTHMVPRAAQLLPPLLEASIPAAGEGESESDSVASAAWSAARVLMGQAGDDESAQRAMGDLLVCVDDAGSSEAARARACELVGCVAKESRADLRGVTGDMLGSLIAIASESDTALLAAAWAAVGAVVAAVPKEVQGAFMPAARSAVASLLERQGREAERVARSTGTSAAAALEGLQVPGFAQAKALAPLLPVYLQALLLGSPDGREAAADGIHDLVCIASTSALRPSVVGITGPLIRVVGDKFAAGVKAAILRALGALVTRGGVGMRPFVPQLQTTFLKCLHDGSGTVRMRAARALGRLAALSPRVDALVTDLAAGAGTAEGGVLAATLAALAGALRHAGPKLTDGAMAGVWPALQQPLAAEAEEVREAAAAAVGALLARAPADQLAGVWEELATSCGSGDGPTAAGAATALAAALRESGGGAKRCVTDRSLAAAAARAAAAGAVADDSFARYAAARAIGRLLLAELRHGPPDAYAGALRACEAPLFALLCDDSLDVRRRACTSCKTVAKLYRGGGVLSKALVTAIAEKLADPSRSVRVAAEKALSYALDAKASLAGVEAAAAAAQGAGNAKAASLLKEHAKRLARLPAHSEDEESDAEELSRNAEQLGAGA